MRTSTWKLLRLEQWICAAAFLALTLTFPSMGFSQTYPNRPIRFVVAFPAGSASDIVARILASKLTEQLGQQVVVDARAGASGVIGTEIAKNAAPDGYTLLLAHFGTFALLPALKPKLPYDVDRDFIALSRVASAAFVLAVHPPLGVGTVAEFVKLAKARPGQLNYGSSGNGSLPHLAGELFNVLADVKTVHIPYKGAVLAINDLIAGQLQFIITNPVVIMPHANTGRLKALATTGAKRDPLLPDLPTVADTVPGFESAIWWGVVLPAKAPAAIVNKVHGEVVKALQTTEVRAQMAKQGAAVHTDTPAEFVAFIKAERERIARLGRQSKITLD